MLETSLIHDLSYNFRSQGETFAWAQTIKGSLLSWLFSAVWQKRDPLALISLQHLASKYYLHCSALFIEALKLFLDLQQNVCYYSNQSKQGNWKKNRGELKMADMNL